MSPPLSPSWKTWMKMWDVGAVAPIVIGYRIAGITRAGSAPNARDRRELTRMGQEKVDAWSEASLAIGQRIFEANLALAGLYWRLGSGMLTASLTPVHRRVVANNRRLARSR